jgi:hypothetical protein
MSANAAMQHLGMVIELKERCDKTGAWASFAGVWQRRSSWHD